MKILFIGLALAISINGMAQDREALQRKILDSVTIISYLSEPTILRLDNIRGTYNFTGKKTEVINLVGSDMDVANKTGRQVFSKVPGVFVYDMDGAGNQINVASRGLDPHRGWEFNIRKDNVITNSDMYGYPASHYSMPLESIGKIELVRGTGSLQYGAQFGGMLNYSTKQGDTTRPFSFENITTAGSFNLLSSYNAIGGKLGKLKYYAYYYKKSRDGYRDNEHTDSEAQDIILTYDATPNLTIRAEWARSKYLYRIPGALNDSMFHADPKQATRSRNYFSPDIHVPSITINWQVSPLTHLEFSSTAVLGKRNSVMFDKPTNVMDTIVTSTLQYNNRQIDIDRFNSYTNQLRLLKRYNGGSLTAGVQYMNNDLHRTQLGKGTTGSDYDLTLVEPGWGRDLHFKTQNIALFAENTFYVTRKFSVNAGARVESGKTDLTGTITYYPENEIPVKIDHQFPLFGAGFSYKPSVIMEIYGGASQAYHPMLFKDLIPSSLYERVDPNIKDAKGYNAEVGVRGEWKFLKWDVTGFLMGYENRFGTLTQTDDNSVFYTYRTNIGNSITKGLEIFVQGDWMLSNYSKLIVFTSSSFTDARYKDAIVKSGNDNIDVGGNKVETTPNVITRNGVTYKYRKISLSLLYSYTAESFADALNTIEPPKSTGAVGLVPSYGLLDINSSFKVLRNLDFRVNINNVLNKQYFTKRPSFYPGPGVWSSEGRNMNASLILKL